MSLRRTFAVLAAFGALVACDKDKTALPPAELVDINQTLPVKELWSASVGDGEAKLRLALGLAENAGVLYAASRDGDVVALDPANGRVRWKAETVDDLSAGPAAGNGLVVVGSTSGKVIALDAESGKRGHQMLDGGHLGRAGFEHRAQPGVGDQIRIGFQIDGRLKVHPPKHDAGIGAGGAQGHLDLDAGMQADTRGLDGRFQGTLLDHPVILAGHGTGSHLHETGR